MAIVFHCEHCGKKIEAADTAGGKRGKCPACHNRVYVPSPKTDMNDLQLAPIDDQEEAKRREMMTETFNLTQQLLDENTAPDDIPAEEIPPASTAIDVIPLASMEKNTLTKTIIRYLLLMADGELDQAEKLKATIRGKGRDANQILEQIAVNQINDAKLAAIPSQVLAGLIRNLRSQIG